MYACFFTGDCINSSPAGKRRIAAEKQLSQLADEGNLFNGDAALMDGTVDGGASSSDQIKSPVAFVALVGVAICSVFVIVFVTVFTVLQVSACDRHFPHFVHASTKPNFSCHFNDGSTSHLSDSDL